MSNIRLKTPCQRPVMPPARQRNRPGSATVCKRFLLVVAGVLLLLAKVNVSLGGCLDDPCNFPSLGYLFQPSPSFHHRFDDASGTFYAPCYGYRSTSWREWSGGCLGSPPPGESMLPSHIGSPGVRSAVRGPQQPGTIRSPLKTPALDAEPPSVIGSPIVTSPAPDLDRSAVPEPIPTPTLPLPTAASGTATRPPAGH